MFHIIISDKLKELRNLLRVEAIHIQSLLGRHRSGGSVVDGHSMASQTEPLLRLGILDVELRSVLCGHSSNGLLEQVAQSLQLAAAIASDELVQIDQPNRFHLRERKEDDCLFEDSETVLEIVMLFQIRCIIQTHLRCDNLTYTIVK